MSNNKFFKSGFGSNFGAWSQFYKKNTTNSSNETSLGNTEEIEQQLNEHEAALADKVDKVDGQSLSENNFSDAEKTKLSELPSSSQLDTDLDGKVNKVDGRELSENNFTDELKSKLQDLDVDKLISGEEITGITIVDSGDIFELKESGFYYATENATNIPDRKPGYFILEVLSPRDKQITFVNNNGESTFIIQQIEGDWKRWVQDAYFTPEFKDKLDLLPTAPRLQSDLDDKVDKEVGKGLSQNDYTNAEKSKLSGIENEANNYVHPSSHSINEVSGLTAELDSKVDKESGKGLSENDFTDEDKAHLYGHSHDELYERKYKETITVNGEADKYYPVVFKDGHRDIVNDLLIYRRYSETGPDTWNTATHRGALTAHFRTNFGGWGGAKYDWKLEEYRWLYAQTLGHAQFTRYKRGFIVFLRGGGAKYHIQSNQPLDVQIGYTTNDVFYPNANPQYIVYAPEPLTEPKLDEIEGRIVPKNADIDIKLDEKVDKVEGKGLSENDFTDDLKTKLEDRALTLDGNQTITGRKKIIGTGELIKFGDLQLNGQDAWMTLGNESSHVWRIKYVGSTSDTEGNEFRIESGTTGKYYQMDHLGNMEYFDGATTHKIWNGSNDGSGSGLDADTLDGIEADGFVQQGGSRLSGLDGELTEGAIDPRSITSEPNFSGSQNYPTIYGQTWTFQGETAHRTFSIHRSANDKYLYVKYWNADGTTSEWNKLLHTDDLDAALETKVDKVEGKGLSENDFTNSLKSKLDGVEEGANNYIHPSTHSMNEVSGLEDALNTKRDKPEKVNAIIPVGSSGWYTIATCTNGRAIARFGLKDVASGRHQSCVFYASHLYGDGNTINVIANALRYHNPIEKIRIKDRTSSEGAALQIYVNTDSMPSTLSVYLLDDNFQYHGWKLVGLTKDGDTPDGISEAMWGEYSVAAGDINLLVGNGSLNTSGDIYAQNHKLATENSVSTLLNDKVDKVPGMGLSENDLTNELKGKLEQSVTEGYGITTLEPKDAKLSLTGQHIGAVKITLPQGYTATMMKLEVDIYDYTNDESIKVLISGYNFSSHQDWRNTSVQILANKDHLNYPVRFGFDGAKCCIYIGELDTVWKYPKIVVSRGIFSQSNFSYDKWISGWRVSIDNSGFQSVTRTHTDNLLQNITDVERNKLAGIEDNANNYTHPNTHAISEVSGLTTVLDGKVDKESGMGLSKHNLTDDLKRRLEQGVTDNLNVTTLQPQDAKVSLIGAQTGPIKITLPQGYSNTMMKLEVDLFDYTNDESVTFLISGYNYSTNQVWKNTSVQILANKDHLNYTVRFGFDGSKCCIYIGEITSTWAYPKIVISKAIFGHMNHEYYKWISGWGISVDNSGFQNITRTHTDNLLQNITDGERAKLAGIETGANKYVHPSTHSINEISGLNSELTNKVDKESGKGLSENDFTDTDKSKLDALDPYKIISGDRISGITAYNADLFDIKKSGFYYATSIAQNRPEGVNGYVLVEAFDEDNIQMTYSLHAKTHSYVIQKVGGVWGEWRRNEILSPELKEKLENLPDNLSLDADLSGKVDKVSGKGLSENDLTDQLLLDTQQNVSTVGGMTTLVPQDARLHIRQDSNRGALKIKLPQYYTNTMIKMEIEMFNYRFNASFKVLVSGYTYHDSRRWLQTSACVLSNNENYDLPVRFGEEGGKCCVYIGNLDTNWAYPQIRISEVSTAFAALEPSRWLTGWELSIEPDGFSNVTAEHHGNLINKFTSAYQSKLDGIASGANNYIHPVTHSMNEVSGLSTVLAGKEASFSKNSAFNKNFGTSSGTVMQGNDSRVANGQTAYTWGNHATANYVQKDASGNLGVGTDRPTVKLEINQLGDYDGIKIGDHFKLRTSGSGSDSFVLEHTKTNGNLYIRSRSASGQTGRLALNDNGGNVGIGASSPQQKLHVKGGKARFETEYGYADLGAENANWFHIKTDQSKFYLNKETQIDGDIRVYGKNTYMRKSDGAIFENNSRVATKAYVDQSSQNVQNNLGDLENNIDRDRIVSFNVDRDRDELQLISNAGRIIAGMPLEDLRREILR